MAKSATIPRFLLPQLTWKPLLQPKLVFIPHTNAPATAQTASYNPPHRTLTSLAQPWYEHGRRTIPSSTTSTTKKSQRRPSFAAASQPPNPLRAAFRILSQKPFSTTSYLFRDHHFDTLKLVQRLKDEGFSEEQSKAMMLVLSDVIEESIQNLTRTMVLREGHRQPFSFYPPPHSPWLSTVLIHTIDRRRPQHLHSESRLYQTPLRTPCP